MDVDEVGLDMGYWLVGVLAVCGSLCDLTHGGPYLLSSVADY